MRLIGYRRVSSDAQSDNTSLDEQERKVIAYCQAYGHDLVQIYTEVRSAKNAKDRPQLKAAIKSLENADGLIACKLDRVARNTRDVLTLVEDILQPKNKALILLDLNVDTSTPTGKLILTVMAAVATLERDVIRERTQAGRRAKSESGGFAFGSPPYGYESVNRALVPKEDEQSILTIMRRHRRSGKSYSRIADYLNANGIPSKQGKSWYGPQIAWALRRHHLPVNMA